MVVEPRKASLHSLSSELFDVLLQHIPDSDDRYNLFRTCTATRDSMLRAVGFPHGPQLTYDLHTSAAPMRDKGYGQLCMQLWLREGPRLQRACNTAVKAAGRVRLCIGRREEDCPTRRAASSAQLSQLMAVAIWQSLTVVHLKGLFLDQLVPNVLTRHCPNLHTLHLVPTCRLLGLGVPLDVLNRALSKDVYITNANPDYNLQQHVINHPTNSIVNLLHPTPCPQLTHLNLDVRSMWPELERLFVTDNRTYKGLVTTMDRTWKKMEAAPRVIVQLQLAQLRACSQQEQQQLTERIASVRAAWQEAYEGEVRQLEEVLAGIARTQGGTLAECKSKQAGDDDRDLHEILDALNEVCSVPAPSLDASGNSTSGTIDDILNQALLMQSGLVAEQWRKLQVQQARLEQQVEAVQENYEQQQEQLVKWWQLHGQRVKCHGNAQYAQQLHQGLQSQVQQQLAALPNLSSLQIQHGKDIPPGLAEGVVQLGTQLTSLKLGTASSLDYQVNTPADQRDSSNPVMPQQLSSMHLQLTNLQQLQWDAVVDNEGMRLLLKLPNLQHVTMVTELSQSFADAQCSWHSLTTMLIIPSKANCTCKQLAYLPLGSLRGPVCVVRNSKEDSECITDQPQLFAITKDHDADLAIVKQACSNVARCGGVSWVHKPFSYEPDTPRIVFRPIESCPNPLDLDSKLTPQHLLLLEASLPLLQGANMGVVVVKCQPLDHRVLSVLLPHLTTWGVHTLNLCRSITSRKVKYHMLGQLPPCITHLIIVFELKDYEYGYEWFWNKAELVELCRGAVRPLTISLKRMYDSAYNRSAFLEFQALMARAHPLVTLVPAELKRY